MLLGKLRAFKTYGAYGIFFKSETDLKSYR